MVNLERHSRHILLPQIGAEGQKKLSEARILCVGAGGLGSPVIQYLAAAGVGHLTIIDDDDVEISNLQRQTIHRTGDVGTSKSESAKRFVTDLDPNVSVTALYSRLTSENILEVFENHDLVIDGTDNIATRYLIDDSSKKIQIPWIYGSVYRFEGQVSVFNYSNGPCYRDLFPDPPPQHLLPTCAEAGVFGVLPGIIGGFQVSEAIKVITGCGDVLSGKLLVYDTLTNTQKILKFGKIQNKQIQEPSASKQNLMFSSIDAGQAIAKMSEGWEPYFIAVRSQEEWQQASIATAEYLCPHTEILSHISSIPDNRDVLVQCRSGMRSELAIMHLIQAGIDSSRLYNLADGIIGWAERDPEGIIYG